MKKFSEFFRLRKKKIYYWDEPKWTPEMLKEIEKIYRDFEITKSETDDCKAWIWEIKEGVREMNKASENMGHKQRVELSIHTNMSMSKGINTASEYVKAAYYNHIPAIAITDHGSVQAFPSAYWEAERLNHDVKIIYGIESYYISVLILLK